MVTLVWFAQSVPWSCLANQSRGSVPSCYSKPPQVCEALLGRAQGVLVPLPDAPLQYLPLGAVKVSAGFSVACSRL